MKRSGTIASIVGVIIVGSLIFFLRGIFIPTLRKSPTNETYVNLRIDMMNRIWRNVPKDKGKEAKLREFFEEILNATKRNQEFTVTSSTGLRDKDGNIYCFGTTQEGKLRISVQNAKGQRIGIGVWGPPE